MDPISALFIVGLLGIGVEAGVRKVTGRSLFQTVGSLATLEWPSGRTFRRPSPGTATLTTHTPPVPSPGKGGGTLPRPSPRTSPGRPASHPGRIIGTGGAPSGEPHPARPGRPSRTVTKTVTKTHTWNVLVRVTHPRPKPPAGRPAPGDGTPPSVPEARPGETPPPIPAGPHTPPVTTPGETPAPVPGGGDTGAPPPPGTTRPSPPVEPWGTPPPAAPTDPTEEPVTAQNTTTQNTTGQSTVTEDIPSHIAAGLDLADRVEDVAEQFETGITDAVRAHIASAEAIAGFPAGIQGEWEDVAALIEQAFALLKQAAEAARVAAAREESDLSPLVEAAQAGPADAEALTVGVLAGA